MQSASIEGREEDSLLKRSTRYLLGRAGGQDECEAGLLGEREVPTKKFATNIRGQTRAGMHRMNYFDRSKTKQRESRAKLPRPQKNFGERGSDPCDPQGASQKSSRSTA